MPAATAAHQTQVVDFSPLADLVERLHRTQDDHFNYISQIAKIAVELKSQLDPLTYHKVLRECGLTSRTVDGWIVLYRHSLTQSLPTRFRRVSTGGV